MPIVDPYVQLSQDEFKLDAYLGETGTFHVLRLVAIQQPQEAECALRELQYFHTLSNTRGYGGFPNAVVAYCDLSQPNSLSRLLEHEMSATIRGVHYTPKPEASLSWLPDLALLKTRGMSLDLTVNAEQFDLIESVASQYPEQAVVINVSDWSAWLDTGSTREHESRIKKISNYDNVYLKICGNPDNNTENYKDILSQLADSSGNQIPYDRLMFSTGPESNRALHPFDKQWNDYISATMTMSARYREKIFRTNAIRFYKL